MRSVIEWLLSVEDLAHRFYAGAARLPSLDTGLRAFLEHMAEDEAWHREVMVAALEACRRHPLPEAEVVVDAGLDARVRGMFREYLQLLENGRLTQPDVIRAVIATELSEWNHLFLYAVRSLEQVEFGIQAVSVRMQRHVREVEHRLGDFPEGRRHLAELAKLEQIWLPRALIVEDREPLALLVQDVLEGECHTRTAFSGEQGLTALETAYFDVVISDVRMPGMDGLEFYRRATERYPSLQERFLFMSGHAGDDHAEQIRALGTPLLAKPFHVDQLLAAVRKRISAIPTRPPQAAAAGG